MDKLFLTVLNMSLTGAFVIIAVILVRLPLKKAPKIISYCLWAVVGFRLVFPFSAESVLSLMPIKSAPIPVNLRTMEHADVISSIDSGSVVVDGTIKTMLTYARTSVYGNPYSAMTKAISYVWLIGVAAMLIYAIVSYALLKRRMRTAIRIDGNIYETDNIPSPFVLGVIKPKIYLPLSLADGERSYIVMHERTHIRRHDHIIKFTAYFILCLHWFNPLVWAAFLLMGVDMEMSCDERVLNEMDGETKYDYSRLLLSLATQRRVIGGSPLAFGEDGVKERVKNILNFKKPSRIFIITAVVLVTALSLGLAVNRSSGNLPFKNLNADEIASISLFCIPPDVTIKIDDRETIEKIANTLQAVVTYEKDNTGREYAGQLVRYTLAMQSGETIEVGAYNPFVFIDGQCFKTKYEPCGELNHLGNQLRGDAKSPYQQAFDIVSEHYPEAFEIISDGSDTISYTDPPAPVEVFRFEVVTDTGRITCAVSKERGIFFTHSDGMWFAFTGVSEWSGATQNMTLDDVRAIAQKIGTDLAMGDLRDFIGTDVGHGIFIMLYEIVDSDYVLLVGSVDMTDVSYAYLQPSSGAEIEEAIDIRYYDVDKYIVEGRRIPVRPLPDADGNAQSEDMTALIQRVENSLSIIMSSPQTSSNPQDYIDEHGDEYENLAFKYSEGVLDYLLSEFETGNSDALRGHIMMRVCKDILGLSNNVTDESLSPQEWYSQLSIISETWIPDFEPDNPEGEYGELVYSSIERYYSQLGYGFLVSAPTVYGAYEEDGKLKIIMTVYYNRYRLFGKTLESTGGGIIPGAAVFQKNEGTGEWIFAEYLEVGSANLPDGAYFGDSIKKLCVMPVSGKEIEGLAEKINSDYGEVARRELLMQNLKEHLTKYKRLGVSLRRPDGTMVELT